MPKVVSVKSLKLVVLRVERYIAKVDDTLKMEMGDAMQQTFITRLKLNC